jgi:hypothetical protein
VRDACRPALLDWLTTSVGSIADSPGRSVFQAATDRVGKYCLRESLKCDRGSCEFDFQSSSANSQTASDENKAWLASPFVVILDFAE